MRAFFRLFLLGFLTLSLSAARPEASPAAAARLLPQAPAAQATLALLAPSTPQPPAGMIDVEVSITGAANLAAFELERIGECRPLPRPIAVARDVSAR